MNRPGGDAIYYYCMQLTSAIGCTYTAVPNARSRTERNCNAKRVRMYRETCMHGTCTYLCVAEWQGNACKCLFRDGGGPLKEGIVCL